MLGRRGDPLGLAAAAGLAAAQLFGKLRQLARRRLALLQRLGLLRHGLQRLRRCGGLLLSGGGDLFGTGEHRARAALCLQRGEHDAAAGRGECRHAGAQPRQFRRRVAAACRILPCRLGGRRDAAGHAAHRGLDIAGGGARALRIGLGAVGQGADFIGDDGEAAPAPTRAGSLDGRVQRQQVGLVGDVADRRADARNRLGLLFQGADDRGLGDLPVGARGDAGDRGIDLAAEIEQQGAQRLGALLRHLRLLPGLAQGSGHSPHRRQRLLRGARRLLRARGDRLHALAQLRRRRGGLGNPGRHLASCRRHALGDLLQAGGPARLPPAAPAIADRRRRGRGQGGLRMRRHRRPFHQGHRVSERQT